MVTQRESLLPRSIVTVIAVLLLLAGLAGPAAATELGTLQGVLRSSSGGTVAAATVDVYREWESSPFASTTTGVDGSWQVALPLGSYQLAFTTAGQTQWAFSRPTRAQSDLYPVVPDEPTIVDNILVTPAWVTGKVTRQRGSAAGLRVRLLSAADHAEVLAEATTDPAGAYRLAVGQQVSAIVQVSQPSVVGFTTYAPGVSSAAAATQLTLHPGDSVTVDVVTPRGAAARTPIARPTQFPTGFARP